MNIGAPWQAPGIASMFPMFNSETGSSVLKGLGARPIRLGYLAHAQRRATSHIL